MTQEGTLTQDAFDEVASELEAESKKPWGRALATGGSQPNVDFFEAKIIFGRKSSCQVHLNHPAISGQHCMLTRQDDHVVWLTDLSTNGTYIRSSSGEIRKIGKDNKELVTAGVEMILIRTAKDNIGYKIYLEESKAAHAEAGGPELDYDVREQLGSGAFAVVKLCVERKTGEKYAMKIIDKKRFCLNHGSHRKDALMDEVKILSNLRHNSIIGIKAVYETDAHLYIVLELVEGGDLFDQVVGLGGGGYAEDVAKEIFWQMLEGVRYLHANNIVHRDLKPENILLKFKNKHVIKISDFGLSRIVAEGSLMKTLAGTPQYLAPEVLIQTAESSDSQASRGYDKAVDLWAMGVILYIMLSGLPPFDSDTQKTLIDQVSKGKFAFPKKEFSKVSAPAKDLITKLLSVDPAKRFTVEQCYQHAWLKKLVAERGITEHKVVIPGDGAPAAAAAAAAGAAAAGAAAAVSAAAVSAAAVSAVATTVAADVKEARSEPTPPPPLPAPPPPQPPKSKERKAKSGQQQDQELSGPAKAAKRRKR